MPKDYVGNLPHADPLYNYLSHYILPRMEVAGQHHEYRVFRLQDAKVYLYEERNSHAKVIGKYFSGDRGQDGAKAAWHMAKEYDNLQILRDYGLNGYPHHVVRPFGANAEIGNVLIEEYCTGISLSDVITAAIYRDQGHQLFLKLTALAYFLATLHNRTANGYGVDFSEDCSYMGTLVEKLRRKHFISAGDSDELYWLRDRWREQACMWEDQQVLVHGDATPSNFIFGSGLTVVAIDLERMKRADRVFDIGRIAGELQHFFLRATGNKYAAEPFIGHFLWEYSCHFPERERAFRSITGRVPFYMGITLLRIARNAWVNDNYRKHLIEESMIILRRF